MLFSDGRQKKRHLLLAIASGCRHVTYPICLLLSRWPPPYWNILKFFCRFLLMSQLIVSPDESQGYLGFSTVTPPPPQRFPFGRDGLKNILVRTFKFGMWVYMGNATNAIVL